jgi:hypothetical protein
MFSCKEETGGNFSKNSPERPESSTSMQGNLYTPNKWYTVVEYDWDIGITSQKELQTTVINENLPIFLSDRKIVQDGLIMLFKPTDNFDSTGGYGIRLQVKIEDSKDNLFVGYSIPDNYRNLLTGVIIVYQKYIIITNANSAQFNVYDFDIEKGLSDYQNQTVLFPNDEFIKRNSKEARLEPGIDCYYVPIGIHGDHLFIHSYTGDNPISLEIYNLRKKETVYIGNWDNKRIEFLDENSVVVYDFHGELTQPREPLYEDQGYSVKLYKYSFNLETEQKTDMNTTLSIDY